MNTNYKNFLKIASLCLLFFVVYSIANTNIEKQTTRSNTAGVIDFILSLFGSGNSSESDCSVSDIDLSCPSGAEAECYCEGGILDTNNKVWTEESKVLSFINAEKYCSDLGLDWRLPTVFELAKTYSNDIKNVYYVDQNTIVSNSWFKPTSTMFWSNDTKLFFVKFDQFYSGNPTYLAPTVCIKDNQLSISVINFKIQEDLSLKTEINQVDNTIKIKVPYDFKVESLTPVIGFDRKLNTNESVSPILGSKQNFSSPIVYSIRNNTLSSSDYSGIRNYTVSIIRESKEVSTCSELQNISLDLSANYILTKDINCSGMNFKPIDNFKGNLDGSRYTITGLSIDNRSYNYPYIGLFGKLDGNVQNIKIVNGSINGWYSYSGGATAGGIAGLQGSGSQITGSSFSGSITTKWNAGGLVGESNGKISNSYTLGSVTAGYYSSRSGNSYLSLGGLVGLQGATGIVSNSYSGSTVNNTAGYPSCIQQAAGLVGKTLGQISNSYSYGRVYGDNGGGCGQLGLGGLVVADYTGSFTGTVTDSYWDKETSTRVTSAGGVGKTTIEMKTESTYTNWNFIGIWDKIEGDYPRLR